MVGEGCYKSGEGGYKLTLYNYGFVGGRGGYYGFAGFTYRGIKPKLLVLKTFIFELRPR